MQRRSLIKLAATATTLGCALPSLAATGPTLDDGNGAYKTRRYRNLFTERLHVSQAQTDQKIAHAFERMFHGDAQEERIYFETGANANGPLAYITDWANNDARSEGMSYGMMIAVQLDRKREFDALWNWSKTYMQNTDPANPSRGYFAWSMNTDGTPRSTSAAPDGEEFYVMALYFAAHRWGNGKGIYHYQREADQILRGMRRHGIRTGTTPLRVHAGGPAAIEPPTGWPSPNNRSEAAQAAKEGKPWPRRKPDHTPRQVSVGPMVDEASYMVRFVPETKLPGTDPSYHLPHFYELWARWGPGEERAFWARAAEASRELFNKATHPVTGLSPDRCDYDGTPSMGWDGRPSAFAYDSWRTVSNWSVDWAWFGKDARQKTLSDRVQNFLHSQGIRTFADKYSLDGTPESDRHSVGMLAGAAVGSLASTPGQVSDAFLKELWETPLPVGEQRYFDGMLYLMSMMHLGGRFRVIEPSRKA